MQPVEILITEHVFFFEKSRPESLDIEFIKNGSLMYVWAGKDTVNNLETDIRFASGTLIPRPLKQLYLIAYM